MRNSPANEGSTLTRSTLLGLSDICVRRRSISSKLAVSCCSKDCPVSVSSTGDAAVGTRTDPASSSSRTCRLMAACETKSSSAARLKLRCRPAASKLRSAVRGRRPRFTRITSGHTRRAIYSFEVRGQAVYSSQQGGSHEPASRNFLGGHPHCDAAAYPLSHTGCGSADLAPTKRQSATAASVLAAVICSDDVRLLHKTLRIDIYRSMQGRSGANR